MHASPNLPLSPIVRTRVFKVSVDPCSDTRDCLFSIDVHSLIQSLSIATVRVIASAKKQTHHEGVKWTLSMSEHADAQGGHTSSCCGLDVPLSSQLGIAKTPPSSELVSDPHLHTLHFPSPRHSLLHKRGTQSAHGQPRTSTMISMLQHDGLSSAAPGDIVRPHARAAAARGHLQIHSAALHPLHCRLDLGRSQPHQIHCSKKLMTPFRATDARLAQRHCAQCPCSSHMASAMPGVCLMDNPPRSCRFPRRSSATQRRTFNRATFSVHTHGWEHKEF